MVGLLSSLPPWSGSLIGPLLGTLLGQEIGYRYREGRYRSAGFRRGAAIPRREVQHEFSGWSFRTRCGVQRGHIIWSGWPFDGLTLDAEWLRIRPFARRAIWISRSEVVAIHLVRAPIAQAMVFRTVRGDFDGLALWAMGSPSQLLGALARFGWPVPPSPPGVWISSPAPLPPPPPPPPPPLGWS